MKIINEFDLNSPVKTGEDGLISGLIKRPYQSIFGTQSQKPIENVQKPIEKSQEISSSMSPGTASILTASAIGGGLLVKKILSNKRK